MAFFPALAGAALLLAGVAAPLLADEPLSFQGVVEARSSARIASGRDGRVAEILFRGGELVAAGDPLIRLDAAFQTLDVEMAEADADAARARAKQAAAESGRIAELLRRKVATQTQADAAEAELSAARAEARHADAAVRAARLAVARSTLRAPIAGRVSRPDVDIGAFVEAAAGPPLARIVLLDPVLVAYQVPYSVRLSVMRASGAASFEALFERITLRLRLPGGMDFPAASRPAFADATVAPATGALTVRAEFANPDDVLRPGMAVEVLSTIDAPPPPATGTKP